MRGRGLLNRCRCFQNLHGSPAAPDPKPPRSDVADGADDVVLAVKKRRVNRKAHKERVNAVALRDEKPAPVGETPPSNQSFRPFGERLGNFRPNAADLNCSHCSSLPPSRHPSGGRRAARLASRQQSESHRRCQSSARPPRRWREVGHTSRRRSRGACHPS